MLKDPQIDEYIRGLPDWQQPIAPDPEGIINQGHGNLTARSIQVRQGEKLNDRALLQLFKAVINNNRAGGWRKLKD